MGWWAAELWQVSPVFLVSWVFWVIASITLHELGHGWAAIRLGDDTPIHTGHMTVNPIVHMGPMSLIAFSLLGFAWGAMPINPSRLKGRHAEAIVAAAGPAMNIGLAATCLVIATLIMTYLEPVMPGSDIPDRLRTFFAAGSMLNMVLTVFNFLPVPPLDGSRIAASYSRRYVDFVSGSLGQGMVFIAMGLLFFTSGRFLFPAAAWVFSTVSYELMLMLP